MSTRKISQPDRPAWGRRGRTDSAPDLAREIAAADGAYLDGALDNPALEPGHVLKALRNRNLEARHAIRIASNRRLATHYEIRAALVNHPATPPSLSLGQVGSLFWRDLLRVADNPRLYPPLRRRAETALSARLEGLSEGETITLARMAGRRLIRPLAGSPRPRVIEALLTNPRLLEDDVVILCRRASVPPQALSKVARSHRWSSRRSIRMALARNPSTPIPDSLRCLDGLVPSDVAALMRDTAVPTIVRVKAERSLAGKNRGSDQRVVPPERSAQAGRSRRTDRKGT